MIASGSLQPVLLSLREAERLTEQLDSLSVWGAASAPLQVAQATHTQPRPGREFFLRQSSREPMASEQVAKALDERVVISGFPLRCPPRCKRFFTCLEATGCFLKTDIRVSTASTKEELSEMLRRQNDSLVPGSVTAAQFLQARKIAGEEPAQSASKERVSPRTVQQGTDSATWARVVWEKHQVAQAAQPEHFATAGAPSSLAMSIQEQKRLEIELGPGGNHDLPYLFTLPISQNERLAWIRLQKQVQAGESLS